MILVKREYLVKNEEGYDVTMTGRKVFNDTDVDGINNYFAEGAGKNLRNVRYKFTKL
jgi:hypothetical protein